MAVQGIHLIWIVVKDLDKAIKYYTQTIGLKLIEHHPEFGWAELKGADGSFLGLAAADKEKSIQAGSNAVIALTVDNLDQIKAEYQKKGVKLIGETMEIPGHVKLQSFADQDGNQFQLAQKLGT
jgi:predicted enzyme related to lactoylglutathione lyase